jgi:predicted dinucleotide-binding enzyme
MCGDDPHALSLAEALVRDLGGVPAVLGGLDRARQLEDVAGFVIRLVTRGFDPATAIPSVPGSAAQ